MPAQFLRSESDCCSMITQSWTVPMGTLVAFITIWARNCLVNLRRETNYYKLPV